MIFLRVFLSVCCLVIASQDQECEDTQPVSTVWRDDNCDVAGRLWPRSARAGDTVRPGERSAFAHCDSPADGDYSSDLETNFHSYTDAPVSAGSDRHVDRDARFNLSN
jgi:hypothetical protein